MGIYLITRLQIVRGNNCVTRHTGLSDKLLPLVETQLTTEPQVKAKQLQLLSSLASDTSELNKELVSKHNSGTKR